LKEKYFPFREKFDIIFCRNVMIYFDKVTRDELIDRFYNCLNEGGYLFVGHSETLANTSTAFKYVIPAVYRKELKT
jgi:chemotaxis protein methyltransferase CheR